MMDCVLGVLKTEEGLRVKMELLQWLRQYYNVFTVEQDPPGALYEFPAISLAFEMCAKVDAPMLYIHTKGAANPHMVQGMIRKMWRGEFGNPHKMKEYLDLVLTEEPRLACPVMGDDSQTWFNAFILNPAAARILLEHTVPSADRYFFECVARGTPVKVVSPRAPVDAHGAIDFVVKYR